MGCIFNLSDYFTIEVCETYFFDDPPNIPVEGGDESNNTPTDSLSKIMKSNCFTAEQLNNFTEMFASYLNGYGVTDMACIHKAVYNTMIAINKKFDFCIDANVSGSASYSASTGNMLWKTEDGIPNEGIFDHEFFHAYQDATIGTLPYSQAPAGNTTPPAGYINIEFETALYMDIVRGSYDALGRDISDKISEEYEAWVNLITNNRTTYPKQFNDFNGQYFYFLEQFNQHSAYAGISPIDYNLKPISLITLFANSNCK